MFARPLQAFFAVSKQSLWLGVLLFILLPLPVQASSGATFTVNSTTDATDAILGDGVCETAQGNNICTLRAAIQESNLLTGADTINIPTGTYQLTIAGALEDFGESGDLDITDDLTLHGDNREQTIIDAGGLDRVIHIIATGIVVTIEKVTIQNGNRVGLSVPDHDSRGAGVYNQGKLTLRDSIVQANQIDITRDYFYYRGGGIYSRGGSLVVVNSLIQNNSGQGIYTLQDQEVLIDSTTVQNNDGEGIVAYSNVEYSKFRISNSFVLSNTLRGIQGDDGGEINNTTVAYNHGGGVSFSGIMRNCEIHHNQSASENGGGVQIYWGSIYDCEIRDNSTTGAGGGVFSEVEVMIENSVISGNQAMKGGGIAIYGRGATIENSAISGNRAMVGGGIYQNEIDGSSQFTLTIQSSLVDSNTATSDGGGVYVVLANFVNTTIGRNTAQQDGGGIFVVQDANAKINLANVTLAQNQAERGAGGLENGFGSVSMHNSIIGNNQSKGVNGDCHSRRLIQSDGYNLLQNPAGCPLGGDTTGNLLNLDPLLGPLQDNQGSTLTYALLTSSPAIDAGNPAGCSDDEKFIFLDQRGFLRSMDGNNDGTIRCDMGAYEDGDGIPEHVFLPSILVATGSATLKQSPTAIQTAQPGSAFGLGVALSIAILSCICTLFLPQTEEEQTDL